MGHTILRNTFHGTEYRSHKSLEDLERIALAVYHGTATPAEKSLARKIRKILCGIKDCRCATGPFGQRK